MKDLIGKKILVTTNNWFYGKDGIQYRSIHGTLKGVHEVKEKLGFVPNRAHANWVFEIGSMIIMGCEIMFVEQADTVFFGEVEDFSTSDGTCKRFMIPCKIYKVE